MMFFHPAVDKSVSSQLVFFLFFFNHLFAEYHQPLICYDGEGKSYDAGQKLMKEK